MTDGATARPRWSATGRRLVVAFTTILVLFGAALAVELVSLRRIDDAQADDLHLDAATQAGNVAAAQIREQYIHQAHTLIEQGPDHLAHYARVAAATRQAVARLQALADTPHERELAAEISRLVDENDRDFRTTVVPAIERGEKVDARAAGTLLESVVDRVVDIDAQLNASFEARGEEADAVAAAASRQAVIATVTCFALAILLAAAVGLWITRFILRRVGALQGGARRVGAGDLDARIGLTGHDEFAELGAAFDQMTNSLAHGQAALVRSQKLAAIGQVAAGVAHEINNPLSVLLGYVKILRKQGGAAAPDELRIIEDEAVLCQRIVQELLDLARPQPLDVAPVDLSDLAREAVERLDETGALHGRVVDIATNGEPVVAAADARKIRQVIANLIRNATDATRETGRVAIGTRTDGDDAVLTIADDGAGMAADVLAHAFDPFFTTKAGGTGLGLAIAQAIVDAHGGRITIESAPGEGTRISLRLPRSPAKEARVS